MKSAYREYLKSEHWRLLRGAKIQISPKCEACGSKQELEVHHKIYRAFWTESELRDLKTLCHGCHITEHAKEWERLPAHMKPPKRPEHKPVKDHFDTPIFIFRHAKKSRTERMNELKWERLSRMRDMRNA